MRLIKDSRPSPAIVIAVLALAVALAGAPLAGAGASPGALTKPGSTARPSRWCGFGVVGGGWVAVGDGIGSWLWWRDSAGSC
jgi:hypothetical protein